MPTRKLKRKQRKTSKNNKMKRGGVKRQRSSEDPVPEPLRKSRRLPSLEIPVVSLGNGSPTTSSYGSIKFTDAQIKDFVNKAITAEVQIVSLPTPPDSHSIIVIVKDDVIQIVDWNYDTGLAHGKEGLDEATRKLELSKLKTKAKKEEQLALYETWRQYTILIEAIETKYSGRPVEFVPIDKSSAIYKRAKNKSEICRMGGCSEYVYGWLDETYIYNNVLTIKKEYHFKKI